MKSFEPTIEDNITVYLKQILKASRTSQPVNMSERVKYLALDIVTRLSFGYPLDTQTKEENRFVSKALAFGLYRGNIWHHVYFLSRLWVYRVFDWIFFESREKYSRLLDKMIRSRVARGPNGERDFYSFISELGTDPDNVRKGELWWEAHFLVVAGESINTYILLDEKALTRATRIRYHGDRSKRYILLLVAKSQMLREASPRDSVYIRERTRYRGRASTRKLPLSPGLH